MSAALHRRDFLLASTAALAVQRIFGAEPRYRIGYTTNTRGNDPATTWAGDPFKGFAEAHQVGFNYVEAFATALSQFYPDDAAGLKKRIDAIGVKFAAITGGSRGGSTSFEDPAARQAVIDNHLGVVRFSRQLRCGQCPPRPPEDQSRPAATPRLRLTPEDLKNIAATLEILGRRSLEEEGIPFGVHAHLGSQLQTRCEIDYVMANSDPRHVRFPPGHRPHHHGRNGPHRVNPEAGRTDRGVPLEGHQARRPRRHEDRAGERTGPDEHPYFFPLGNGGVDFLALKAYLDSIQWKGFLVVELDTSPWRPPMESARISANYIRKTLKIS